jgi:sortase A
MSNHSLIKRKLKFSQKISLGLLILGLCFISLSSFQIYKQSAPEPVKIEQLKKKVEPVDTSLESVGDIKDLGISKEILTQSKTPKLMPNANEILYPIRPKIGENIGNLTIPAINQVLPIVHGTDEDELSKGIGHFGGSVLPGESDNSVLSGHRDTVFRELGELEITDQLIVETSAGKFTYEISEIKIVPSDDKSIITPTTSATLTVTTCYPFNFIGSSPDRYILTADLVSME